MPLTLMCVELLGGTPVELAAADDDDPVAELSLDVGVGSSYWALTRAGRNRAAASAKENFIVVEKMLHSQSKMGQEWILRLGAGTLMCEPHQRPFKLRGFTEKKCHSGSVERRW